MNLVFENINERRNLTTCAHIAYERDQTLTRRFGASRIPTLLFGARQGFDVFSVNSKPDRYIFPVNCYGLPAYWSGQMLAEVADSPFDYVPGSVMDDLKACKALIVFESLFEGYYDELLYKWLHDQALIYDIPLRSICYISGAITEARCYKTWCEQHDVTDRCLVLGDPFLLSIGKDWVWDCAATKSDHTKHKKNNKTWLYNCLNLRPRHHRELMLCHLIDSGLIMDGLISHSPIQEPDWLKAHGIRQEIIDIATEICPLVVDDDDFNNNKANSLNPMVYIASWISVINETLADDGPQTFLSEKIVKPLMTRQPFMIWGQINSLKIMHELGFKTFHGFIDESYDSMPFDDRCKAIVKNLQYLKQQNLSAWWAACEPICEHNYQRIMSLGYGPMGAIDSIKIVYSRLGN